ncbi:calcium-binding protein [Puniceibacterium sp. IMCC21224]|uniref:calcium-binding protein n=1 Tax=Puniceibacterium sp. IMCC21224 TaxID=1618204 RepID=UPI00065D78F2|nr:calcium-binding protein [Puniceibacterium sp. IMCC21224]KMK68870.1 putative calcium-binding protein [Puniceibacterium sp. IMCC21224]
MTDLTIGSGIVTARILAGQQLISLSLSQFGTQIADTSLPYDLASVPTQLALSPTDGTPAYVFDNLVGQYLNTPESSIRLTADGVGGFWVIFARAYRYLVEDDLDYFDRTKAVEYVVQHFDADLTAVSPAVALNPVLDNPPGFLAATLAQILPDTGLPGTFGGDLALFYGTSSSGEFDALPLGYARVDATTGEVHQTDLGLRAAPYVVTPVVLDGVQVLRLRSYFYDTTSLFYDNRFSLITDHDIATGAVIRVVATGSPIVPSTIVGYITDDRIEGTDQADLIAGLSGDDSIPGRGGDDTIDGGDGNDMLAGAAGNDSLQGGKGDDVIGGGPGDDTLRGGFGNDELRAGQGNDRVLGDTGNDSLSGGPGNDTIFGFHDDDELAGGPGDDMLRGQFGDDLMGGGAGNDTLIGSLGDDTLFAGIGDDILMGDDEGDSTARGNDDLNGGRGNDTLFGGLMDDTLNGGFGDDLMTGGDGFDVFVFARLTNGETDIITDFTKFEDRISLTGVPGLTDDDRLSAISVTDTVTDGVAMASISYAGHTILLQGYMADDITITDFLFV